MKSNHGASVRNVHPASRKAIARQLSKALDRVQGKEAVKLPPQGNRPAVGSSNVRVRHVPLRHLHPLAAPVVRQPRRPVRRFAVAA